MLVWEGDHFATVHHSNERIRREERNVIGRRRAVDDRGMLPASGLTAAGREYC